MADFTPYTTLAELLDQLRDLHKEAAAAARLAEQLSEAVTAIRETAEWATGEVGGLLSQLENGGWPSTLDVVSDAEHRRMKAEEEAAVARANEQSAQRILDRKHAEVVAIRAQLRDAQRRLGEREIEE